MLIIKAKKGPNTCIIVQIAYLSSTQLEGDWFLMAPVKKPLKLLRGFGNPGKEPEDSGVPFTGNCTRVQPHREDRD